MLDIEVIRLHPDKVKQAAKVKGVNIDVDELLSLDTEIIRARSVVEELQRQRNVNADNIRNVALEDRIQFIEEGRRIAGELEDKKPKLSTLESRMQGLMLKVPNIPAPDVPVGRDDTENVPLRKVGEIKRFSFAEKDHVEILEAHNWVDFKRIALISGSRNYALKNDALLLEQAVVSYALDLLRSKNFELMSVPSMIREEALIGTGHFPDGRDQVYHLPADNLYLSGTAEVPINSLFKDEIISFEALPLKIAGVSACFRREAGSAGRDVRGLIRVHQFLKVEQYIICENSIDESVKWQEHILSIAEEILCGLELPYRVIECCTGDMGLGKYKMFDIECWVPSEKKYRETHSCSSLLDWQARRTGLRYRDKGGKVNFCYTLNNTAIASPRILVPLLENHQEEDGRIRVPQVLRKYLGNREYLGEKVF